MSKTYVLSGATGMIGRALIAELLSRGDRVIALVRPNSRRNSLEAHENLAMVECDLSDYAGYTPTMQADVFLHLASPGPLASFLSPICSLLAWACFFLPLLCHL